jgi:hypothetical protein
VLLQNCTVRYAYPKPKIPGLLKKPAVPAQCDVVRNASSGGGIVKLMGVRFGFINNDIPGTAKGCSSALAA